MGLQDMLLRKMLQSKLQGVPEAEQEKIFDMLQKHPELFQKIAMETQELMKSGLGQMDAVKKVMEKYKTELENIKK